METIGLAIITSDLLADHHTHLVKSYRMVCCNQLNFCQANLFMAQWKDKK